MVRGLLNIPAGGKTNTIRHRLVALFGGWKPKSQWKCPVCSWSRTLSPSWIFWCKIIVKILSASNFLVCFSFLLFLTTSSIFKKTDFIIFYFFRAFLGSQATLNREFLYTTRPTPTPATHTVFPPTSPTGVVHLLQVMSLESMTHHNWHIVIASSPGLH